MNRTLSHDIEDYQEVLRSQRFHPRDLDYRLLDEHITFLERLDEVGSSCISIFDLYRQEHRYLSPRFAHTLGYDMERARELDVEYINARIHPEDFPELLRRGTGILRFCLALPIEQRKQYKLINEYRLQKNGGGYLRVLEQIQTLELDRKGNIWLALSLIDIAPDQDFTAGVRSTMVNFTTGEIIHYDSPVRPGPVLSRREAEILALVRDGKQSSEIAEQLFISVHTVNTHRQRILEKLGADNSHEAIRYAARLGLV